MNNFYMEYQIMKLYKKERIASDFLYPALKHGADTFSKLKKELVSNSKYSEHKNLADNEIRSDIRFAMKEWSPVGGFVGKTFSIVGYRKVIKTSPKTYAIKTTGGK